jgi:hypothetical protein
MYQNEIPHDPSHLGFHHVRLKWLPSLWYVWHKPCTYLVSRLALSPNRPKQASTWASSPRRTIGCIQNDFYICRKPCTYLALTLTPSPNGPKRASTWASSPKSTIGCVQTNFLSLWYVWRKTVHLSCSDTNTVSKRTETRFHMSHVTLEFHRVCQKRFPSLWCVRRKQCTYLESRLALCPNVPKRGSTWASPPWSSIRSVQNDFRACSTFGTNFAPILHWH